MLRVAGPSLLLALGLGACGFVGLDAVDGAVDAGEDLRESGTEEDAADDALDGVDLADIAMRRDGATMDRSGPDTDRMDADPMDADRMDADPTDGGDAAPDAGDAGETVVFASSDANSCREGESGPFVEVGSVGLERIALGLWFLAPYIVVAETTGGFASYRFDGSNFEPVDRIMGLGFTEGIYHDGDAFVVGAPGRGLFRIAMNEAGALSVLSELNAPVVEARQAWGAGNALFVPNGGDGFHVLRRAGDVYTPVSDVATAFCFGAAVDGSRVYLGDSAGVRLYNFNASSGTLMELDEVPLAGAARVWVTPDLAFAAGNGRAVAYGLESSFDTPKGEAIYDGRARSAWSDGLNLFVATESPGELLAYRVDSSDSLNLQASIGVSGRAFEVTGDGEFIYLANDDVLRAYTGFRCTSFE
ncbi:MAG: hypothetical protein AAF938_17240 [Myxococcota bacterium]